MAKVRITRSGAVRFDIGRENIVDDALKGKSPAFEAIKDAKALSVALKAINPAVILKDEAVEVCLAARMGNTRLPDAR